MSYPIVVSKVLAAASSTAIATVSSAGVVTLSGNTLDTPRRITIAGASLLGPTFTIVGTNGFGNPVAEVVPTSTLTPGTGTTTQDFLTVTSITLSCALVSSGGVTIGTNTQGGTHWRVINSDVTPTALSFSLNITSPSTVTAASFEYTLQYPNFNPNTLTWVGSSINSGPVPTVSSLGSTVTSSATVGNINFPISAWRMTITSTSSAAGSVQATVLQSGY